MRKISIDEKTQALLDAAEEEGWGYETWECPKDKPTMRFFEFNQFSPFGEDYRFTVDALSADQLCEEVWGYAENFDVDEHVELWVDGRGTRGIPSSIRSLIEDAESIKEMLESLACAMQRKQAT